MLKIYVDGFRDDCIRNVTGYFFVNKTKDWFNRQRVKEIIKNIDDTIAVKDEYLESPVFGGIYWQSISDAVSGNAYIPSSLEDMNWRIENRQ